MKSKSAAGPSFGLSCAGLALAILSGCTTLDPNEAPTPPCKHYEPPAKPARPTSGGGTVDGDYTFALFNYDVGDRVENGEAAYLSFGYDLDHTCTTSAPSSSCRPPRGAGAAVLDGPDGRDHSANEGIYQLVHFGLPEADLEQALGPFSKNLAMDVSSGRTTAIFRLRDYNGEDDDDQVRLDMLSATRQYFLDTPMGVQIDSRPPLGDGHDHWYTSSLWLRDGQLNNDEPVYSDKSAYVSDNILVAHFPEFGLGHPFRPGAFLRQAIVTARLSRPQHDPASPNEDGGVEAADAGYGVEMHDIVFAGRWPVDNYLTVFGHVQSALDPRALIQCEKDETRFARIQDVACTLLDLNTEDDSGAATCDALSLVYNFDAVPAVLDPPVEAQLPPIEKCDFIKDCAGKLIPQRLVSPNRVTR